MIGLMFLCLFSGLAAGIYLRGCWAVGSIHMRPESLSWTAGGLVLVLAFVIVGRWQARRGQRPLGFSNGGFAAAIGLSYLVGAVAGIFI